jgi:hypothetical protein
MYGLIAVSNGLAYFVDGEIALGTDEHGRLLRRTSLAQEVEKALTGYLVVAMSDVFAALAGLGDEIVEGCNLVEYGLPSLMALFGGSDNDFLESGQFDDTPFGKLTIEERISA